MNQPEKAWWDELFLLVQNCWDRDWEVNEDNKNELEKFIHKALKEAHRRGREEVLNHLEKYVDFQTFRPSEGAQEYVQTFYLREELTRLKNNL